ncbi:MULTISPECIES: hypothetical protein [Streptomyces]|uniref:hypothetical protein n=1 Tax=Streptomyces TaxID=1883 RepID=UPI000E69AFDC|nr:MULTISPECIES: hypothetical protein [Streptomyces]MDX3065809.1 hypothetical protein [Streptomyces sp. ND04-05B]MDX3519683.1 hypothetical protein [Streptomyces scabiei]
MADIIELVLSVDLHGELSEEELVELRWHLGLGPEPEFLSIVTEFPCVVEDEHGRPLIEDHPEPLLAQHGEAFKVGGALTSTLSRTQDTGSGTWTLTSRQEIHPDDFERTGRLLGWLATRARDTHRQPDGRVELGGIRFYEERRPDPLAVREGTVLWPS